MSALTIIAGTLIYNSTLLCDLALHRVKQQQQYYSRKAIRNYGIACCKIIDTYSKPEEKYEYIISQKQLGVDLNGVIAIFPSQNQFHIETSLYDKETLLSKENCMIVKDKECWRIV